MHAQDSAIIFDLDGTVWDSAPGIISCLAETLEVFGIDVDDRASLSSYLGPPLNTMLSMLGIADEAVDDARVEYRRRYRDHGEFECTVYPGVEALLHRLRAADRRLGVATSKGDEIVARMLEHFGLAELFDTVHAASMTAAGHGKVDLVGAALRELGASRGVMIGDRRYDIEGGRHHGLQTIGVSWGYADPGELEAAGADHIVANTDELAAVLSAG
ncbi:MAG: HAD hydrolase-like protein [Actinobacteria bacterium]|nr:HAD hydrolase-like protein [Actinomycetota bacterium]